MMITGEGQVAVFVAVDHGSAECVKSCACAGYPLPGPGAVFPKACAGFWRVPKAIAHGLAVRHDHGSRYMSDHFQKEVAFLGLRARRPPCAPRKATGRAQRFDRHAGENLLWVRTFKTIEELPQASLAFRETEPTAAALETNFRIACRM